MKFEVKSIWPHPVHGKYQVKVSCNDEAGEEHNGGDVVVFVPVSDSISEIQRAAIQECKRFFLEAAA